MSVNQNSKSMLAKLLATENIEVVTGNYKTASFDVKNRTLQLPYWSNLSSSICDLFVTHEVGHALYTPIKSLEAIEKDKIPFSYFNIAEDDRIERMILKKYPGMYPAFMRGYDSLASIEYDFFGIHVYDINEYSFMDRLNIFCKMRGQINVPFTSEEMSYVQKVKSTKTWKDVVSVVKEIVLWLKDKKEEKEKETRGTGENISDGDSSEESLEESFEESFNKVVVPEELGASEEGSSGDEESVPESITYEIERRFHKSVDSGNNSIFKVPDVKMYRDCVVSFKDVYEDLFLKYQNHTRLSVKNKSEHQRLYNGYQRFNKELTKDVNAMIQEFEMRKAAARNARSRVSNKGTIDVNKLHSASYNEDIFRQVTTFQDGKSHGIVVLLDFSGSMYKSLSQVIKQMMTLALFCRKLNIPIFVYSFTSSYGVKNYKKLSKANHISIQRLNMNQLLTSKCSKRVFETMMMFFYGRMMRKSFFKNYKVFHTGGTPLAEALMLMPHIAKDFDKLHAVDKKILVVLTDGAAQRIAGSGYLIRSVIFDDRKVFNIPDDNNQAIVCELVRRAKKIFSIVINFHIVGTITHASSLLKKFNCDKTEAILKSRGFDIGNEETSTHNYTKQIVMVRHFFDQKVNFDKLSEVDKDDLPDIMAEMAQQRKKTLTISKEMGKLIA